MKHGGDIIRREKMCTLTLVLCISIGILSLVLWIGSQNIQDNSVKIGLNENKNILEVNAAYKIKVWYKLWHKAWYKYEGKWRYKWKYMWKYRYVYKNKVKTKPKPKKTKRHMKVPSTGIKAMSANNQTNSNNNQTRINPNRAINSNKNHIKKIRQVYITCDNIYSKKRDRKLVNAIVKALKKKGVYAVNYGIGPNKHISVLKKKRVPKDALVVNIYGGACALTLWEMGTKYYKKIKGKRKVFTVMYPPAKKITGLSWLPKAHDDHSGKISGLERPDRYLLKRGYHYVETGNLNLIVNSIYNEAVL